ncbi:MAG: DUF4905 domain-containing protein [Bacteroidetes bacterium]|nr:DUF4905 domain-containing protein [Bacteroidota bacterium]
MQLFRKRLSPTWTFRSDKKVWRLLPGSGVLAVELRDTDNKITEFAGLDIETGSSLWQNFQLEEKWWVTVNKIYNDVLLLQQFVKPDMPTPGKIFAVDLFTGKPLWQNHELSYLNIIDDVVYGLRRTLQSEDIVGLNYRTGEEREVFSADDTRAQELSFSLPEDDFILPSLFEELEETPDSASAAVLKRLIPTDAKTPTVIESPSGKEIVGYHQNAGTDEKGVQVYDSHLKIIDGEGKILFEDVADKKVYSALQDFYFAVNEQLIYVRNSNEIVAVKLS